MDIMTALFDQDVVTERHEKALAKEIAKEIAKKMIAAGEPDKKIAEYTGLTVEWVEKLHNLRSV